MLYQRLGTKPKVDTAGNVVLDEHARAKDILLVVMPLFTASLAYWTGARATTEAKEEANQAKKQLNAVIDVAGQDTLVEAKAKHSDAFTD